MPANENRRPHTNVLEPTEADGPRWALVTGGSRGIGRAVALELGSRGWDVAIAYLQNDAAAEAVAGAIRASGRRCLLHRGNLANPDTCHALVERLRGEVGQLAGLVHCAALGALSPTLGTRPARWQITWETHVGAFLGLLADAESLLTAGAGVVAVTSVGTRRIMPGYASIAAAKGALEVLVRYLAVELSGRAVHVNAVCGGPVDTDSLRSFSFFDQLQRESVMRPPGRLGRPEDLAPVIAFLLSPAAAWIRGQVVVADGGFGLV